MMHHAAAAAATTSALNSGGGSNALNQLNPSTHSNMATTTSTSTNANSNSTTSNMLHHNAPAPASHSPHGSHPTSQTNPHGHAGGKSRPHVCDYPNCGLCFAELSHLRSHQRSHGNTKAKQKKEQKEKEKELKERERELKDNEKDIHSTSPYLSHLSSAAEFQDGGSSSGSANAAAGINGLNPIDLNARIRLKAKAGQSGGVKKRKQGTPTRSPKQILQLEGFAAASAAANATTTITATTSTITIASTNSSPDSTSTTPSSTSSSTASSAASSAPSSPSSFFTSHLPGIIFTFPAAFQSANANELVVLAHPFLQKTPSKLHLVPDIISFSSNSS